MGRAAEEAGQCRVPEDQGRREQGLHQRRTAAMNMQAVPRAAAGTQPTPTLICADTLRLRYGEVEAVSGVSLEIESGEFVSLLGPSGCGKSSILRAIAGLVPVAGGTLTIAGGAPGEGARLQAGMQVGMMFQKPLLLPW